MISITIVLIIVTCLVSLSAFNRAHMLGKLVFWPYEVKRSNDWFRFITSGFIHGGYMHLVVNMFVLFSFGTYVESSFVRIFGSFGVIIYIAMYLLAIVVSELASFIKHQDNPYYRSLGASGAVSAVLFSSILLEPRGAVNLFLIPIDINSVLFGVLYIFYSYYMDKKQMDNVGHSAHMYGAIFGFVFPIILKPTLIVTFFEKLAQVLPI